MHAQYRTKLKTLHSMITFYSIYNERPSSLAIGSQYHCIVDAICALKTNTIKFLVVSGVC